MTEKELIGRIQELRQIKPRKDWVSLTKKGILGEEPSFTFFPYLKPAFAGFIAVFILFGTFGFIQNSLPGDLLYAFKRTMEKGQAVFIPENERSAYGLKLANDRLEDLTKAPAKNLAPALFEFQASISEAARNLAEFDASSSDPMAIQKIVLEAKKLEENKQKIESLGVILGEQSTAEINSALAKVVENLINDLEDRTLSVAQGEMLLNIKEFFSEAKYSEALEFYLTNQ